MEEMTVEQAISRTINEYGQWVRIGWIPFHMRPVTYGQIVEISACVSTMDGISEEDTGTQLGVAMRHGADAEAVARIASIMIFRSRLLRFFFRRYIRNHITTSKVSTMLKYLYKSIDPDFFLTTIIFLKGINQTKPTKTTAPLQSSQE